MGIGVVAGQTGAQWRHALWWARAGSGPKQEPPLHTWYLSTVVIINQGILKPGHPT